MDWQALTPVLAGILPLAIVFLLQFQQQWQEQRLIKKRLEFIKWSALHVARNKAEFQKKWQTIYRKKTNSTFSDMRLLLGLAAFAISFSLFALPLLPPFVAFFVLGITSVVILIRLSLLIQKAARETSIRKDLPGTLDVMVICLTSGLGLNAALEKIAKEMTGSPLGTELLQIVNETNAGLPLEESLRHFSVRAPLPEVTNMVANLIQAYKTGATLSDVFRIQATTIRERMRLQLKEQMLRLPVLLTLPLVVFILPVFITMIMGPIVLGFMRNSLF